LNYRQTDPQLGQGARVIRRLEQGARRSHPIAPYEVLLRVGEDFSVGRMIQGLNTNDSCVQLLAVVVHVPEKFELR
jgi:hypothetical protein